MKFIILGSSGQLGKAFTKLLPKESIFLDRAQADLCKFENLKLPIDVGDCVINCAGYTKVDDAEKEEDIASRVNGDAVGSLAEQCAIVGAKFVHFSTDYVFDGSSETPYKTDDKRSPINAYGRSKLRGEELLQSSGANYLLIRTSWVYAPWGNNFLQTMLRLLNTQDEISVVNDQFGRPTHVIGLAQRTLKLIDLKQTGTFHITDGGSCSWFEFAKDISHKVGSSCNIKPCSTNEFPRQALRPSYSVLDTSKTDEILGPNEHYKKWLDIRTAV